MSDKYQKTYKIPSTRLQNWNYAAMGSYFITICTKNKEYFFGEFVNGVLKLSEIGKIAELEWLKTKDLRPDMNLEFGEYVVMPNHFHAIIIIGDNEYNGGGGIPGGGEPIAGVGDARHCVSTVATNKFGPQSKNLASIVRGFKSSVTKYAKEIDASFAWQERYHEHIIRNQKSFETIQEYIATNPSKWAQEKFNCDNVPT